MDAPVFDSRLKFGRDRYVVLPSLLKDPTLTQFYRYACTMASKGRMGDGDSQVPGTPNAYGDFMMDGLLTGLLPDIEAASGLDLFPTYSYFRVYRSGDSLARHTDRESCEISVTLCLGYDVIPWPIWVEGPHGASCVTLLAGDGLLYRGTECPHWRETFDGPSQAQVFLHYVDQKGPYADWRYDKRSDTARLESAVRISKPCSASLIW